MASSPSQNQPPHPAPHSSMLWAQILRKPVPQQRSSLPPHAQLAPQDKAGTSTRILLHDTHARLEAFSGNTEMLMKEVLDARREMSRVTETMASEREKASEDLTHLVNRCQTSLQKTLGEPAQARGLSEVQAGLSSLSDNIRSFEGRMLERGHDLSAVVESQAHVIRAMQEHHIGSLKGLEKVIQLQSQAIQNMHDHQERMFDAMRRDLQILQDHQVSAQTQHTKVVELVAPLLPLLNTIPLLVEQSREAVLQNLTSQEPPIRSPKKSKAAPPALPTPTRVPLADLNVQPSSSPVSSTSSYHPSKKRKPDSDLPTFNTTSPVALRLPAPVPIRSPAVARTPISRQTLDTIFPRPPTRNPTPLARTASLAKHEWPAYATPSKRVLRSSGLALLPGLGVPSAHAAPPATRRPTPRAFTSTNPLRLSPAVSTPIHLAHTPSTEGRDMLMPASPPLNTAGRRWLPMLDSDDEAGS